MCVRMCLLSFGLFCYLLHCNCKHFFIRYVYINPMRGFGVTAWIMLTTAVPREALPIIHRASVHQVLQCMHNNYSTCHAPGKVAIFLWNRQTQLRHATTTSQYFCGTTKLRDRPHNNNLTIFLWNRQTQKTGHATSKVTVFLWNRQTQIQAMQQQSHNIFVEPPNSDRPCGAATGSVGVERRGCLVPFHVVCKHCCCQLQHRQVLVLQPVQGNGTS